jgi:hypothetical protein
MQMFCQGYSVQYCANNWCSRGAAVQVQQIFGQCTLLYTHTVNLNLSKLIRKDIIFPDNAIVLDQTKKKNIGISD